MKISKLSLIICNNWFVLLLCPFQAVAVRVLSLPPTSCAGERLFSTFASIWNDKRNRILLGRMWLMAFIFFNTRVMQRR